MTTDPQDRTPQDKLRSNLEAHKAAESSGPKDYLKLRPKLQAAHPDLKPKAVTSIIKTWMAGLPRLNGDEDLQDS